MSKFKTVADNPSEYAIKSYKAYKDFLGRWKIEDIQKMTLTEYNAVGSRDSFCYWLEHESKDIGLIGGVPSNKFGIWQMKDLKSSSSDDFLDDGNYKWYRKYGDTADVAFEKIKELIVQIIYSVRLGEFHEVDDIDYFSLVKWKIAFIYSDYRLLPIYRKSTIRQIAKNFEFLNYKKAPISELHSFVVSQKEDNEDFFDFSWRQFWAAEKKLQQNYYIIGSKYEDKYGNNVVDISPLFYKHNVVATGFFWDENLSNLYGKEKENIEKWIDKNLAEKYPKKYQTAKRTLSYFLGIKPGDIIAIKSHGQYRDLTIIAYAEVIEKNGSAYFHSPKKGLGHCLHVNFFETGLYKKIHLSYGQTIHKIIPGQKEGHFQKIFGSYSALIKDEVQYGALENDKDFELSESRINEKQTDSQQVRVSYSKVIHKIHNKLQSAFARYLQEKYPNQYIYTEKNYIDIVRQSDDELFYYEVKPFNNPYTCIRAGIGQLLDYYHSNPSESRKIHLRIVGPEYPEDKDVEFIEFIKSNLQLSFDYITFKKYND